MAPVVVAVTGASSGVGRATAQAFAREGATVGLIARGQEALAATASEVESLGGQPVVLECDVADPQAVEATACALEEHGEIAVWVNNAMASVFAPTWEIIAEELRRVTEVTYLGVVYGTLCALSRMRPRDRGVIVQVGSALAYRGIPLQSPYCARKHAIQGFTESLRCELMHERSGVRVTMVQLPAMNTPQFDTVRSRLPRHPQPVPPIYQPEVAARAIVAASRESAGAPLVDGARCDLLGPFERGALFALAEMPDWRLLERTERIVTGGMVALRRLHSGCVNDYIAWLGFGLAVIGGALALT